AAVAGLALFVACDTPAPVESDAETEAEAAEVSVRDAPLGRALAEGEHLVIVDGVVQGSEVDLDELDPSEIASVEVVKGPSAEQLYGERAGDGVIQITTKEVAAKEVDEVDAPGSRSDVIEARIRLREDTSEMTLRTEDDRRVQLVEIPEDDVADQGAGQLRGITSLGTNGAPGEPLIIVDGVVQGDDAALSDLNTLDIESIEIVKGAAAERLYGERASDGVIQITTKDADGDGG
ncbi:MAG: TonB-dependent receptor plug domain-containing protein, partial [Gemmatimonadota bacterium]